MLRPMQRQPLSAVIAIAAVVALGVLAPAANAKPRGPDPREMMAAQTSFSAIADSDAFLLAARNWDWESAKAMMSGGGISPNPEFPAEVPKCAPPSFLVVTLQWGYGPNPPPDGPSQWHPVWIPMCVKIKPYELQHAISVE